MTHAEIKIEPFGGSSATELMAASLSVLGSEPELTYEVNPQTTTVHGERGHVLAAARHIEQAFTEMGAVDYLLSIRLVEGG